jgi:hypothetical protein
LRRARREVNKARYVHGIRGLFYAVACRGSLHELRERSRNAGPERIIVSDKRKPKRILAAIAASKNRIAAERDKLRDLISDVEEICTDADDAVEQLNDALEVLSRYL